MDRPELITLGVLIIAGKRNKDKRVPTFAIVGLIVGSLAVVGFNMLYLALRNTQIVASLLLTINNDLVS